MADELEAALRDAIRGKSPPVPKPPPVPTMDPNSQRPRGQLIPGVELPPLDNQGERLPPNDNALYARVTGREALAGQLSKLLKMQARRIPPKRAWMRAQHGPNAFARQLEDLER